MTTIGPEKRTRRVPVDAISVPIVQPAMTTAIEHEEYVRSRWEQVEARPSRFFNYSFSVKLPVIWDLSMAIGYFQSEDEGWSEAYAFTLEREEQIREVREEMALLRGMIALLQSEPGDETAPIYQRTINRLQEIVAELRKGMK